MGLPPLEGWREEDVVLVSALEHWSYCPRQCALIHVEQTFDENLYTLRGRMAHERVDTVGVEQTPGARIERGLSIWSARLGLTGKADVVEFHDGVPYPIEYKHGARRQWGHDDLQLCAQALCLEEMTGQTVARGAIYHHGSRRRREVVFNEALRRGVEEAVEVVRGLLSSKRLPPPVNDARCTHCSLRDSCLPGVVGEHHRVASLTNSLFVVSESERG